jgi:hypothetical protein
MDVKKIKVLILALGIGFLHQSFASDRVTGASPYPWPWPWAKPCKMNWNDLRGYWQLTTMADGSILEIEISQENSSTMAVTVRRYDNQGIHSDGVSVIKNTTNNVVITMLPERNGVQSYRVTIKNVYKSSVQTCDTRNVATILTIEPLPGGGSVCQTSSWLLAP